ncbi:MAG: hypothetical protein RLZ13_1572 [Bacteroidota bacterium]|jgi:hypothetical protein
MKKFEYKTEKYGVPLETLKAHFNTKSQLVSRMAFSIIDNFGMAIPTKNGKNLTELLNEEGANGWEYISSVWILKPYNAKFSQDNCDGMLEVFFKREV